MRVVNKKLPLNSKACRNKMAPWKSLAWGGRNKTVIREAVPSGPLTWSWGGQTSGHIYLFQLFATPPQINLGAVTPKLRIAPKQTCSTLAGSLAHPCVFEHLNQSMASYCKQINSWGEWGGGGGLNWSIWRVPGVNWEAWRAAGWTMEVETGIISSPFAGETFSDESDQRNSVL